MKIIPSTLHGAVVVTYPVHPDPRGFFTRIFDTELLRQQAPFDPTAFVQESQSRSTSGVLRGLHGRRHLSEAKLVHSLRGAIRDVIVDLRPWSPTFLSWESFLLDDVTHRQLFIPAGFAHGFEVLSDVADIHYRMDAVYAPELDYAIRFDDPELGVTWTHPDPQVSDRDLAAMTFADARPQLGQWYGTSAPPAVQS